MPNNINFNSSVPRLQQCEEDKVTKDSQIRALKQELTSQEELVAKLQREKKAWADGRQQKEEELQAAEDKANHLTKIKMKLEQNLDELEDSVEREKKNKNEVEKAKRKIEGDLQVTQQAAAELEHHKAELAQSIQRKEREFGALMAKIEDEASLGIKQQKQIKELSVSGISKNSSSAAFSSKILFSSHALKSSTKILSWNVVLVPKLRKAVKFLHANWKILPAN